MRYIVAVSGGVDSVVLLDSMVGKLAGKQLIVAHFDHGIRVDSASDAVFVRGLAQKYKLPFAAKREELGANASEELARERRYAFLRAVAKKYQAKIVTAHHADDSVETIAINVKRGTGWRGLAVLDSADIVRPLLGRTKAELIEYAEQKGLEWREDSTNADTTYLRNDLRQRLTDLDSDSKELLRRYRTRQVALKRVIDREARTFIKAPYSRYFFTNIPQDAALELLRSVMIHETGESPVKAHLERALLAIKTYQMGKRFDVDAKYYMQFSRTNFAVRKR